MTLLFLLIPIFLRAGRQSCAEIDIILFLASLSLLAEKIHSYVKNDHS